MSLLNVPFELSQMRTNDGRSICVQHRKTNKKNNKHTQNEFLFMSFSYFGIFQKVQFLYKSKYG